ncbi:MULTISPECIES: MBL fold metallo-hydrolase [Pyrobaculum]|uniref:Beta-lactamase domain protein n=2 Tax=Pyrobaculum arsenaticum TaxID=121277 RepID=A4WIP6_PYRAR|nr:MBL fold metallo-hydrolase [Pyrobaculum arsenaticum]ABP50263.1 beta-lactamase domain protein [Pyrobaculum arsenaticum DSM 13514]MCY0889838.1 MBL fold metallo-hydrolase [Pyrobaculum arsenaticum]NYR14799.1 MBL fold metallo-hydrolase [Pyrobaculum arsenaticum]
MNVERIVVGPLATNAYLACSGDECVVIDPGDEAAAILKRLGRKGLVAIIATHLHFDHVGAVLELAEATGAPFYAHPADWAIYKELNEVAEEWGFSVPEIPPPKNPGLRVWELDVLHTPGHTPGSISLVGDGVVFTGDTLFHMSVGRTDLPGGDWDALVESVCRLYGLPRGYLVYPGHGPATTIGNEAEGNPFVDASVCDRGVRRNE